MHGLSCQNQNAQESQKDSSQLTIAWTFGNEKEREERPDHDNLIV
jgi:hypothetical protein